MKKFFEGKKLKPATKAEIKGFVTGSIIGGLSVATLFLFGMYNQATLQNNTSTAMQYSTNTSNLLYKEANKAFDSNSVPEVTISDIHQDNKDDSSLASSTITIANTKSNNTLVSTAIARAEIREDGNLIKIIDVDNDDDIIIKPHSIESFVIDFPVSSNAKELKIEVYSPATSTPISAKTFDLSSDEYLTRRI